MMIILMMMVILMVIKYKTGKLLIKEIYIIHQNIKKKIVKNEKGQRELQAKLNFPIQINTEYKLSRLGEFEYSPTMESDFNNPYLAKNKFPELAQKFKDHQMDVNSGIVPIYASIYHDNGG